MGVKQVRPKADEVTEFGWEVYPQALSEMILHITKSYPGIPIYLDPIGLQEAEQSPSSTVSK